MICEHCGGALRFHDMPGWGWVCGSWWDMEGGCPHPTHEIWGDWSWTA